jgi:hypothetical protein
MASVVGITVGSLNQSPAALGQRDDLRPSGYRLQRLSDWAVLPEEFSTQDVREADAET